MKKLTKIWFPALLAAASFGVPAAGTTDFGNIVFIGDSITQSNGTSAVSYRYQLWKIFVDNGVDYKPVGSMDGYYNGSNNYVTTAKAGLISDYRGKTFNNTNEGHYGWNAAWLLDQTYAGSAAASTYPKASKTTSSGNTLADYLKNTDFYPSAPDTATILMGINDLARGAEVDYTINTSIKGIVDTLQNANGNVTVHVFSVLPDGRSNAEFKTSGYSGTLSGWDVVLDYNTKLEAALKTWSTGTSMVVYHDITAGYDPTNGVHTYDKIHPNAQGELIIAGNMARALGLEQRTNGLERKGGNELSQQVQFSAGTDGIAVVSANGYTSTFNHFNVTTTNKVELTSGGNLQFSSDLSGYAQVHLQTIETAGTAQNVTFSISLKMLETTSGNDNYFGMIVGTGGNTGVIYIGENGIYWGSTAAANLLYGCTVTEHQTGFMTEDFRDITISYVADGTGAGNGFYIWLDDQLIGEAKSALSSGNFVGDDYKTGIVLGDFLGSAECSAEIASLSYEIGTAYAPISLIPEPSLFGVFAGTLAMMLAGTRRKRRGNGK